MSKFAVALFGLIVIALAGVVTFSYLKLSGFEDELAERSNLSLSDDKTGISNQKTLMEQATEEVTSWADGLSSGKRGSFVYPALELSINFDVTPPEAGEQRFLVMVEQLDAYRFFCLNYVLNSNGINYAYYKNGGRIQLMINARSEQYLKSVLEQLKQYEIQYQLQRT
ncbi:hypothetical protein CCZ01_01280 [Helicobacter monodelphidis]|uniref:hypothetical protein n=1 Tax=Helicobacter sp. 15-1451 TaxID=2004995 RepID=UPI000DCCCC57|nr:hypothetical protein [Helicobacter sp. 15-1451]RAX58856.1 hypothetical protein CCZ01_01280 [Helicobacter sp. 15-1451]